MSHTAILGPDGAIARRLYNYEVRPQQLDMADAVARAIAERRHLMVEAGTGAGKSFAYLVPAVLADRDCRVFSAQAELHLFRRMPEESPGG
jgi:Rad3-related DNA helicase